MAASSNGGGASTAVVAISVERSSTIRPPTWESGSGHSQRSPSPSPIACATPRAFARMLPNVISCGFGAAGRARRVDDQRDAVARRRLGQLEHAALVPQRPRDDLLEVAREPVALGPGQPRVDRHDGRAEQQRAVERLDERQPGRQREADGATALDAAHVQRARRAHGAQQQLAVRDRLVGGRDGDAVGMAPCGAREPVAEVHREGERLASPGVSVDWTPAGEYEDIRYD